MSKGIKDGWHNRPGRPKLPTEKRKRHRVSIFIDDEEVALLEAVAREEGADPRELARDLFRSALRARRRRRSAI